MGVLEIRENFGIFQIMSIVVCNFGITSGSLLEWQVQDTQKNKTVFPDRRCCILSTLLILLCMPFILFNRVKYWKTNCSHTQNKLFIFNKPKLIICMTCKCGCVQIKLTKFLNYLMTNRELSDTHLILPLFKLKVFFTRYQT